MKITFFAVFALITLQLYSCNRHVHNNIQSAETKIRSVLAQQVDDWNRGDIEAYMQGYWQSDSLRFASGGTISQGWTKVLERYRRRYSNRDIMGQLTFTIIDVDILGADAALVFGKWELERSKDKPWGLFTLIMKKTGDEWRVVHDHTSSAE